MGEEVEWVGSSLVAGESFFVSVYIEGRILWGCDLVILILFFRLGEFFKEGVSFFSVLFVMYLVGRGFFSLWLGEFFVFFLGILGLGW